MRLFGCFGALEEEQRLFKACYLKMNHGHEPIIFQDKEMDYFYAQDVGTVIEHYIMNYKSNLPLDINLCLRYKI